jgi:tetratricopeptide (TPR) repeat protein
MRMSAIANSKVQSRGSGWAFLRASLAFAALVAAEIYGFAADNNPAYQDQFRAHAEKVLAAAQKRYETEPTNSVAAWELGRACFGLVTVLEDRKEMERIINEGIAACRASVALDSGSAAGHYYLAITVGKLADLKRNLAAYGMVKEVEREFHKAQELDERFCYAGPDRCLGELYLKAPGWPLSVGSRSKARKHLERAAELSPDFPENRLLLAEAYEKWHDKKPLARELEALEKLWPAARTNFAGADWAADWTDWQPRFDMLRGKVHP